MSDFIEFIDVEVISRWLRGAMAAHLSSKQKVAGSIPVVACYFYFSYSTVVPTWYCFLLVDNYCT
jgi:hypothetical protein